MSAQPSTASESPRETSQQDGSLLVCNVGSSSLKLNCYPAGTREPTTTLVFQGDEDALKSQFEDALPGFGSLAVVLHRVVHAGLVSREFSPITAAVKAAVAHWLPLAPLHNRLALETVGLIESTNPKARQYAAFDSGLYADLPPVTRVYALPAQLQGEWPPMRYGFHGLAHRSQWRQIAGAGKSRMITVQLGGGCSVTAWRDGQAVDTTMGYSPTDGLVMATRSGALDPILVLKLLEEQKLTAGSLESLLQRESGLKGLSGVSGDVRELLRADTPQTRLALEVFSYQVRKQIGAFAFALGGLDAISFGGGVGENQPLIRQQCLAGLGEFGIKLDLDRNAVTGKLTAIQSHSSKVEVFVAPVDEMTEMLELYYRFLGQE